MADTEKALEAPATPAEPAKRITHATCRASSGCTGTVAEIIRSSRVRGDGIIDGGGGSIVYQCKSCGGSWAVNY